MDNSIFIQKTLLYAETDSQISIELLRLMVLMVGVDVRDLFDIKHPTKTKKGTATPYTTKHDLLNNIRMKYTIDVSPPSTTKTRKQRGGFKFKWTPNHQQKWDALRKDFMKWYNNEEYDITNQINVNTTNVQPKNKSPNTFYESFQAQFVHFKSFGVLFALSLVLSIVLNTVQSFSSSKKEKTHKLVYFFNHQLIDLKRIEDAVQEHDSALSYKTSGIQLQFIDKKIHSLFQTYKQIDQLRYHLLRLKKKRSLFEGRSILKEHLIRNDGSIRVSCGEIARAVFHYWENRHLLGILYYKAVQTAHSLKTLTSRKQKQKRKR